MVRSTATPLLAFLACASGAGCIDTSNDTTVLTYPTLMTVDPALFRGSLACGAPGLVRFVATLEDVSVDLNPDPEVIEYPTLTSPPTRCNSVASFGDNKTEKGINAGHYYIGTIDGYDRDDITPLEPGKPTMIAVDSGEIVAPRWTTTCGEIQRRADDDAAATADALPPYNPLRSATLALGTAEVILRGCLALAPVAPMTDAGTAAFLTEEPQNTGKSTQ